MEGGLEREERNKVRRAAAYRQTFERVQAARMALIGQNASLEDAANHDALTQLPNRRAFEKYVREKLANIEKNRRENDAAKAWVVLMDIDHFKAVNDTWGHPAGDAVLQAVSAGLRAHVRGDDMVARWGGEEFIMLLVGGEEEEIEKRAEGLCEGIQKLEIKWREEGVPVTASSGVARVAGVADIEAAIARADGALYKAKENGRNQVVFDMAA